MSTQRQHARSLAQILLATRPANPDQLHRAIQTLLNLHIPRKPIIPSHDAPFDYLVHAFFEGRSFHPTRHDQPHHPAADCIVWANRGGGKTYLGAVATMLDLIYKPGIQVRILGGSREQSSRMYTYLRKMFEQPALRALLHKEPTLRRIELVNASTAELLAQSHRSVRGQRIHKLRCDEVEEFDPDIWQAAQLVTRSTPCGNQTVTGAIEALSTMHRPFGIMAQLIDHAQRQQSPRIFKWSALDVVQTCPPEKPCDTCDIQTDCQGRAKHAHGFIPVDDLIAQFHRTSNDTWASELLCQKPQRTHCVYPDFSPQRHVRPVHPITGTIVAGVDFGLRSPMVILWAQIKQHHGNTIVEVFDEYIRDNLTLERHLDAIAQRPRPQWLGVDPAGAQRNNQTGLSDITLLRRHGYKVRAARHPISQGIECIRRRLDRNTLFIDPACKQLIQAIQTYHFDPNDPANDTPVKDGPDHPCDALRYLLINLETPWKLTTRTY